MSITRLVPFGIAMAEMEDQVRTVKRYLKSETEPRLQIIRDNRLSSFLLAMILSPSE